MKKILLNLFIICFISTNLTELLFSEEKEYEFWGDEYFENNIIDSSKIPLDILQLNAEISTSKGFFPKILFTSPAFIMNFSSKNYNYGTGKVILNSQSNQNLNTYSFNISEDDLTAIEDEKKEFSLEDKYGLFNSRPQKAYNIGIGLDIPLPRLYMILTPKIGWSTYNFDLYSSIFTNYYLDYYGNKTKFKECSLITINNKNIYASIDISHPIWGAFINSKMLAQIASYYYIKYGIGAQFNLYNTMNSYNYILSHRNDLRYDNGEIKKTIFENKKIDQINTFQYYGSFALGWRFISSEDRGYNILDLNLRYKYIISPYIKNYTIKQHSLSLEKSLSTKLLYDIITTIL